MNKLQGCHNWMNELTLEFYLLAFVIIFTCATFVLDILMLEKLVAILMEQLLEKSEMSRSAETRMTTLEARLLEFEKDSVV